MNTRSFSQHFSGYEILGELGRGNARVLKAKSKTNGQLVAIKHFSFNTDADTIRRFQRESEIMTAIHHPNIVKVLEVQLNAELPYLVMELVDGGDLRTLINVRKKIDTDTVQTLCKQMVQAFDAIHSIGIIHRDVKPENIMCRLKSNNQFDFLLTDFGIARIREQSHTITGNAMMTFEYASPEQWDNPKHVTQATDYYSLGVVLYECMAGRVPFPYIDGRLLPFVQQVLHSTPPKISEINNDSLSFNLVSLIDVLLTKNAAERISTATNVFNFLEVNNSPQITSKPPSSQLNKTVPAPAPSKQTEAAKQKSNSSPTKTGENKDRRHTSLNTIFFLLLFILTTLAGGWYYAKIGQAKRTHTKYTPSIISPKLENNKNRNGTNTLDIHPMADTELAVIQQDTDTLMLDDTYQKSTDSSSKISYADSTYRSAINFSDNFYDNTNKWPLLNDSDGSISIKNGMLHINGYANDYAYLSGRNFSINTQSNFEASVNVRWILGMSEQGFGMDFCCSDDNTSGYTFLITADGYYCIKYFVNNDEWQTWQDWTASPEINKNNSWNNISVRKENNEFTFLINGRVITSKPFTQLGSSYFGVRLEDAQQVDFDDFKLQVLQQ